MLNFQIWHVVLTAAVLLLLGGIIGGRIAILVKLFQRSDQASVRPIPEITDRNVTSLLRHATQEMRSESPEKWAEWAVWMLKELDGQADEREFREALNAIRAGIDTRLEEGWW
jgi:hypothetical protein